MTDRATLAIIGASLAGAKAAEGARDAGFGGRIVLIGEEPEAPYERPPLSKEILRGEKAAAAARLHPESFYEDHDVQLLSGQAVDLDAVNRAVTTDRGDRVAFDTAVIATGAAPRHLAVPGADLAGVHYLRTVGDAVRLQAAIKGAARIAVIGAGWIGSEVAASARQLGAEVTLIDPTAVPLQRVLGDEIGAVFAGLHADHGVRLRLGTGVTALRGKDTVEAVGLDGGTTEEADVVIAGIGVVPRTELAEAAAGLRVDNGIVVDQHLETNVAGIYAAGDVANTWHPHYQRLIRVEHWANALNQGMTAGGNAVGRRDIYDRLPYFFSDQYDLGLEYVGHSQPGDAVVIRGDLDARKFIAFWHRDGNVTAAMNVNVWDVVDDLKAIVGSSDAVDPAKLADPESPLISFMPDR